NDMILSINNQKVSSANQLMNTIAKIKPNSKISVVVKRGNQELELGVTVGKRPKMEQSQIDEE
ncbi:MAG TPA: PDZ domain-containing protein, partial [Agitococcus sp.]|nr:PDZ domain-containing protein [Agitococcus sp.]